MSESNTQTDELLETIDDGDVHDQLLGYMVGGETAEEALRTILFALPSFNDLSCRSCGTDLTPLDENDFVALRLKVAGSDHRRTDLYCGTACYETAGSEAR